MALAHKWRNSDQFNFEHPRVTDFVSRFQSDLRGFYGHALERSGRYVPGITPILRTEGVPEEFAYLPLIESGFRTQAVSPARAVGLWQFIPGTGRRYGLRIDQYVDERRDPVPATHAAARYLKDLYAMFGDWHLTLAAYNTGEGRITGIIERGEADDYWEMTDRGCLYRETSDYVPEFLAAVQIAGEPELYGFVPPQPQSMEYDQIFIARHFPLAKLAQLCDTSADVLRELNPALIKGVIPPGGYGVKVPVGRKVHCEVAYASLTQDELDDIARSLAPRPRYVKKCVRRHGKQVCSMQRVGSVAHDKYERAAEREADAVRLRGLHAKQPCGPQTVAKKGRQPAITRVAAKSNASSKKSKAAAKKPTKHAHSR